MKWFIFWIVLLFSALVASEAGDIFMMLLFLIFSVIAVGAGVDEDYKKSKRGGKRND